MFAFPVGEGTATGYLALPKSGEGPGVLVLHAWWGLNDFFKSFCDRLSQAGYVALAPDLYHGRTAATVAEAEQLVKTLDGEQASADIAGAVAFLRKHPAVQGRSLGCLGFSLGASFAFSTSCTLPDAIAAVVAFYGAGPLGEYTAARAAYLGHFVVGDEWEEDEYVAQVEEAIRAAGRDVTFYRYDGVKHWFMEDNRPDAYNAETAALAWQRTLDFLRRHLAGAALQNPPV